MNDSKFFIFFLCLACDFIFHTLQTTGIKAELAVEQAAKRPKVETVADVQKAGSPISLGSSSTQAEMTDRSRSGGNIKPHSSDTSMMMAFTESSSFKQSTRQQALAGPPFVMNRFKLDNRPTSFKITPPLPSGLANVSLFLLQRLSVLLCMHVYKMFNKPCGVNYLC